jgi:hypothetical protein
VSSDFDTALPFVQIPNLPSTDKVFKMTSGMASNLFHLNHNFLTHKCPNLSTKRHLFKHTEIYGSSAMIAYAPEVYFANLACSCMVGYLYKKESRIKIT